MEEFDGINFLEIFSESESEEVKRKSLTCQYCDKKFTYRSGKSKHIMNHCPVLKKVDLNGALQASRKKLKTNHNEETWSTASDTGDLYKEYVPVPTP